MKRERKAVIDTISSLVTQDTIASAHRLISRPETSSNERMRWYLCSYPVFARLFSQSQQPISVEAWIQRVACVFSWIARIPTPSLDESVIRTLDEIESRYKNEKLWSTDIPPLVLRRDKDQDNLLYTERNGDNSANARIELERILKPANTLLNGSGHWDKNLATTTKLLHFMSPNLFPIMDKRIANILEIGKMPNLNNYSCYFLSLRAFLVESKNALTWLVSTGENPLRIIDLIMLTKFGEEQT